MSKQQVPPFRFHGLPGQAASVPRHAGASEVTILLLNPCRKPSQVLFGVASATPAALRLAHLDHASRRLHGEPDAGLAGLADAGLDGNAMQDATQLAGLGCLEA